MRHNTMLMVVAFVLSAGAIATAEAAKPFTALNAPDAASKSVLQSPLHSIDQGATSAADASWVIHRNFPRIVEQNFARLQPTDLEATLARLSETELEDFAQLYVNATMDTGRPAHLLDILAHRASAGTLGYVSRFFGFAPVYDAVLRVAPGKAVDFSRHSRPDYAAPVPGVFRIRGTPGTAVLSPGGDHLLLRTSSPQHADIGALLKTSMLKTQAGQFVNYTPNEIYLSFRTAPVGSLGVTGALYETATLLGKQVAISYYAGWAAGSAIQQLLYSYAPSLYATIGGTINQMVANYTSAMDLAAQAQWQSAAATLFGLTPALTTTIVDGGGDFMVAYEWYMTDGGGSGKCGGRDGRLFCDQY